MKYKVKNKRIALGFCVMMIAFLIASCAPQRYPGHHHRKARRCNCPSFTQKCPPALPVIHNVI